MHKEKISMVERGHWVETGRSWDYKISRGKVCGWSEAMGVTLNLNL